MHPEIRQKKPGDCPTCGMKLVLESKLKQEKYSTNDVSQKSLLATYQPLFIIVLLIVLPSFVASLDIRNWTINGLQFMEHWMAGFFLVFAGFKLLNVSGFAEGYSKYDLLAKQWKGYGYVYPFIELTLGLLYLQIPGNLYLNAFTLALMLFSGLGVAIKLAKREKFQCACLGTFIDVPLTKVTLVEDFGMAAMAAAMLLIW